MKSQMFNRLISILVLCLILGFGISLSVKWYLELKSVNQRISREINKTKNNISLNAKLLASSIAIKQSLNTNYPEIAIAYLNTFSQNAIYKGNLLIFKAEQLFASNQISQLEKSNFTNLNFEEWQLNSSHWSYKINISDNAQLIYQVPIPIVLNSLKEIFPYVKSLNGDSVAISYINLYKTDISYVLICVVLLAIVFYLVKHFMLRSIKEWVTSIEAIIEQREVENISDNIKPLVKRLELGVFWEKQLAQERIQLELKEKESEKYQLVLHDLKSPLTGLNALIANEDNSEKKNMLTSIKQKVDSIQDILKSEDLKYKSLSIHDLINESYASLDFMRDLPNLILKGDDFSIWTDRSTMQQILCNFIINCHEANPEKVSISFKTNPETKVLIITDDGLGIDEKISNEIFKKGFTKGKKHGTGLGLYFAKEFLNSLAANIEFENQEFRISF